MLKVMIMRNEKVMHDFCCVEWRSARIHSCVQRDGDCCWH